MLKDIVFKFFAAVFDFWDNVREMKGQWAILGVLAIILAISLFLGATVALVMGVYWVLWYIFCFIVPFWFPSFKLPDYWTFSGTLFLIIYARNVILGKRKTVNEIKD